MEAIIIYLDDTKKNKRVIRPTKAFDGDVLKLVLSLTHSSLERNNYQKNYHSFEIIK